MSKNFDKPTKTPPAPGEAVLLQMVATNIRSNLGSLPSIASDWADKIDAAIAALRQPLPKLNISCETVGEGVTGTTSLPVIRVEAQDDGSFTAVTNYWPPPPLTEGVSEEAVERVAALLYTEATDEPWLVAGVAHTGFDRDYYRDLARRVLAERDK